MLCDCMGGNGFREEYYPKPALNNRRNWRVAEDWRTCAYLLLWELQNYNSLLNNRQLENVGSHQKRIPHVQGQRRSPSKIVGGVKCSEGSHKPCVHQDPETPQRLSQNCVWVSPVKVWVSSGPPQGQGLWVQQTWVWHKPSWRSPLTLP